MSHSHDCPQDVTDRYRGHYWTCADDACAPKDAAKSNPLFRMRCELHPAGAPEKEEPKR